MKIEKLRNNHKKEIIIGTILTVVIGGALSYKLTHSKYRVTQSIDLGSGVINYKTYDFKIMAIKISDDGKNYSDSNEMPTSGYVINEDKTYCTVDNKTQVKGKIKTINGNHVISGLSKSDKCYLYFDKGITVDDIIAANNPKSTTPDFSQIADTNEGVFKAEDGMYGSTSTNKIYTYYWRGVAATNHVIFANKCWRIVRINGDKTIRLIYNGPIQEDNTCKGNGANSDAVYFPNNDNTNASINLNRYATTGDDHNNSSYVGWTYTLSTQRTLSGTPSNAKTQAEEWYNNASKGNLKAYENKIADGKFCNDRNTQNNETWRATGSTQNYAGYIRIYETYQPTFNCPNGDVYTLKVGAITADEVAFAGGGKETNLLYYMYTSQRYWTMSPSYWDSGGVARMFFVYSDGNFGATGVGDALIGLRPVINLRSNVIFSSGDGTISSPYVVS